MADEQSRPLEGKALRGEDNQASVRAPQGVNPWLYKEELRQKGDFAAARRIITNFP